MVFFVVPENNGYELENRKVSQEKGDHPFLTRVIHDVWAPSAAPAAKLEKNPLVSGNNRQAEGVEVMNGLVEGAIYRPGRALKQLVGISADAQSTRPDETSSSHKTGLVLGSLIPYVGLVGLTRGATSQILGRSYNPTMTMLMGEQATAGFLMGSLLTPSDLKPGDNIITARLNQGGLSAATFATITGTTASLDHNLPKADDGALPQIARQLSITLLSGVVGQYTDIQGKTSFGAPVADSLSTSLSTIALDSISDGVADRFKDSPLLTRKPEDLKLPQIDLTDRKTAD